MADITCPLLLILAAAAGGAAAAVSVTGCGDAAGGARGANVLAPPGRERPASRGAVSRHAAEPLASRHAVALQLSNGFRAGLDRLAVLQQPTEGAADIGQPLPAGLLRDVRCGPGVAGAPAAWTCRVRWETAAGRPQSMRYAVRLLPRGCFAARARPPLRQLRDPTIKTFTEHPLSTIVSVRRGC